MRFGEKLKKSRLEAGLSQDALAEKIGVTRKTISCYESGKRYPKSRQTYAILAEALNVNEDALRNEYDDFIVSAADKYGYKGRKQAEALVDEMGALFAGGTLSEEDMDGVMKAMQDHYWRAKEINRKYTPKKYLKEE